MVITVDDLTVNDSRPDLLSPAGENDRHIAASNLVPPSPRRRTPSIADVDEEEYVTAGDETPAPRWAPISDNSAAAAADYYSESPSSSHGTSCSSSSSSTPLSPHGLPAIALVRTDSVVSAPPSAGRSAHSSVDRLDVMRPQGSRRSSIADIAVAVMGGTPLPDLAPASPTASGALGGPGTASSKMQPVRFVSRKPNLNPNPRPTRSLFCLTLSNPLRKLFIRLVEYKYPFSVFVCRLRI